jgi:hypothetical protein
MQNFWSLVGAPLKRAIEPVGLETQRVYANTFQQIWGEAENLRILSGIGSFVALNNLISNSNDQWPRNRRQATC